MAYTRKFNYNMGMLAFAPGFKGAFMDKYLLELEREPKFENGKFMVAMCDLEKIYGPDFIYKISDEKATVEHGGKCVEVTVTDGMVDAIELLGDKFEKPVLRTDDIIAFCEKLLPKEPARPDGFNPYKPNGEPAMPRGAEDFFMSVIRGKTYGDTYHMYWNETLCHAIPYRLFVPYTYDASKPWKLITVFHGGGGTPATAFVNSQGKLQFLADKYGYLIVAPDVGIAGSSYGAIETVAGMRHIKLNPMNPTNPAGYSDEELLDKKLCEENTEQIIENVCSNYNIDREHIYLMGNSMGGEGTLHFASTHPELFCAISPAGAMLNTDYFNDAPLGDMPIFLIGGLEDFHGFDFIENGGKILQQRGRNLTIRAVAGGEHGTAWIMVLDEIFDFFEKNA